MTAVQQVSAAPALMPGATVRALALQHLPGLLAVQRACYGASLVESAEVFARRLASPANCSLVLEMDGEVCAYLAAYHSEHGKVTPLQGDFETVAAPGQADTLYLHDMAVLPRMAGRGCARRLLSTLCTQAVAQGLPQLTGRGFAQALLAPLHAQAVAFGLQRAALVSVQGSQAYWEHQGYAVERLEQARQRVRLASYGASAVYMARRLGADTSPV